MRQHLGLAQLCQGCCSPLSTGPSNISLGSYNLLLMGQPPHGISWGGRCCCYNQAWFLLPVGSRAGLVVAAGPPGRAGSAIAVSLPVGDARIQEYEKGLCSGLGWCWSREDKQDR